MTFQMLSRKECLRRLMAGCVEDVSQNYDDRKKSDSNSDKKIAKERSYTNDGDARDVGLHKGNLLCHKKEKTLETLENLP